MTRGRAQHGAVLPIAIGLILLLWELPTILPGASVPRWGTPSRIFEIIWGWAATGVLWPHAWSTLSVAAGGLVLGCAGGVLLAYAVATSPYLRAPIVPLMAWLNALPRILLVPFFIAALGIGLSAKLAMVIAMTIFPFFFNVLNGLLSIDPRVVANARILGASRRDIIRSVHLPLLIDWLMASARTALGFAMIGAVISEYMGATSGLGYLVDMAYGLKRYDRAVAGLVVIFVVVGILDVLVHSLERTWGR